MTTAAATTAAARTRAPAVATTTRQSPGARRIVAPGAHAYPECRMAQRKVLLVEDEPAILEPLVEALQREGFATHTAGSVSRALDEARKVEPDLVLLDLMLPD